MIVSVVSFIFSKTNYNHCSVLVGSRNGFELDIISIMIM